jgi:hypothetical protein
MALQLLTGENLTEDEVIAEAYAHVVEGYQRALAAFTLKTYVHLLDPSDLGGPVEPVRVKKRSSEGPETAANSEMVDLAETVHLQA